MLSFRGIAFAIIVLSGSGISLFRPYIGMLFLGVLYFFRPDVWGMEEIIMPVKWLTAAILIGYLGVQKDEGGILKGSGWILLVMAMYLVATMGAPMTTPVSWDRLSLMGKIFVTVFLIQRICNTPRRMAGFIVAMLIGIMWFVKAAILSWWSAGFGDVRFDATVGQGGGANYIAWLLAAMIPFLYYKAMRGQGWQRWTALGLIPLFLAAQMATGSRGGLLALAAATGTFLLLMRKGSYMVLAAGGVLLFIVLAPGFYMERMSTITTDPKKMDDSALSRYQNMVIGKQIMRDYPLFGTGLETFPAAKMRYLPSDYAGGSYHVAHNTYVQMGAEAGLPLLAVYLGITMLVTWRLLFRRTLPCNREDADHLEWIRVGTLSALAATLVQAVKGDMAHMDFFWWVYGMAFGYHQMCLQAAAEPATAETALPEDVPAAIGARG